MGHFLCKFANDLLITSWLMCLWAQLFLEAKGRFLWTYCYVNHSSNVHFINNRLIDELVWKIVNVIQIEGERMAIWQLKNNIRSSWFKIINAGNRAAAAAFCSCFLWILKMKKITDYPWVISCHLYNYINHLLTTPDFMPMIKFVIKTVISVKAVL